MTQLFSNDGISYPVTVLEAGPCNITKINVEKDVGYNSIKVITLN